MASVRRLRPKDPKSQWVVEYTDASGTRRRRTPKGKLKSDAEALRREIEAEIDRGIHLPKSATSTVKAVSEGYLRYAELRLRDGDRGPAPSAALELVIRRYIVPALGNTLYTDLTEDHIERWYNALPSHLSLRSRRMYLSEFSILDAWAYRKKFTRKTVVRDFREQGLRSKGVTKIQPFTMDTVRALLLAANERPHYGKERAWLRMRLAVHLALFCGLRRGEIYGLTLQALDFDRRVIKVRNSLTAWGELKGPKTASGERDIPMPDHVMALLADWVANHYVDSESHIVFTSYRGSGALAGKVDIVKAHQQGWRALLVRAGLHDQKGGGGKGLHFHALRHFASSWYLAQGMSPPDVAKLLGHSSFDITLQVYAHPVYDEQHRHAAITKASSHLAALAAPGTAGRDGNTDLPALTY